MTNIHGLNELMVGARNYVNFANVKEGEEVLIVASTDADPLLIQAVSMAVNEASASATLIYDKPPEVYFKDPSPSAAEAMCAADTVLDIGSLVWAHSMASLVARYEYCTKGVTLSPPPTPAVLRSPASKYPLELHRAVSTKVYAQCQRSDGTKVHLSSPGGTDLIVEVWRDKTGHGYSEIKGQVPSEFAIFPPGCLGFTPPKNVNGRAVFEAYTGFGRTSKPIEFEIQDQYVTEMRGGYEVEEIKRRIRGVKDGNYVTEVMFGMNPKARVDLSVRPLSLEAERTPRTLHIGMGDSTSSLGVKRVLGVTDSYWPGKGKPLHQDGFMLYPTLRVGDETVIEHGNLKVLEDPEIREIAAKYGDPDWVLAYGPVVG